MVKLRRLGQKAIAVYSKQGPYGLKQVAYFHIRHNIGTRLFLFWLIWREKQRRKPMSPRRIRFSRSLNGGRLRLHVGCGSKHLSGYVNIDKYHTSSADVVAAAHELRFMDNSVDEIYTSHMIEHLRPSELALALHEWNRVLKPGGKLRIRCPNFELYVREWLEGDYDWRWGWGIINIFGHDNRGEGLLTRNGFTCKRLGRLLSDNGFRTVRCEATATRREYEATIEYRPDGDLYYEGVKVSLQRVLYVDALSEPEAQTNINGITRAYRKASILEVFDYRRLAQKYGRFLMNRLLVQTAVRFRPDLIHLGKSELISGAAVRKIKKKTNATVIHFYGDFRWKLRPHVVDIGKHADHTFLYHKDADLIKQYAERGVRNIGFWCAGTDPDVFYPRGGNKLYDIVFMANNSDFLEGHRQRRDLIDAIVEKGTDLHLYGNGWEYLSGVSNVHLHPFVNDEEFAEACSAAKITLGYNAVNNVYMYASWRRPLNSMACGAFHVTSYFPGLEEIFENSKHLVWFNSIPEAIELIQYYLNHDKEREKIAETGRQEVVSHHTWNVRIKEMLGYVKE